MTIGHIEPLILLKSKVSGVPVILILAGHDLLYPTDSIEIPAKQVVPHLLKPSLHAVGVPVSPDMDVLCIS
jgi:hypothetical protein